MIQTSELWFARADRLGDPFEGSFSAASLQDLKDWHPSATEVRLRSSDDWRQQCLVNCWHQNDDESVAMWNRYGDQAEVAAIRSTFDRLKGAIKESQQEIYVGQVQYIDYQTESISDANAFDPLLHKRRAFDYEREVRAIAVIPRRLQFPAPEGLGFPVTLAVLVEAIYVAPAIADDAVDRLRTALDERGLQLPLRASALDAKPRF
jgi:hypothetical protein